MSCDVFSVAAEFKRAAQTFARMRVVALLRMYCEGWTRNQNPETQKAAIGLLSECFLKLRSSKKQNLERETRLELATPTLARSCSTN